LKTKIKGWRRRSTIEDHKEATFNFNNLHLHFLPLCLPLSFKHYKCGNEKKNLKSTQSGAT